MPLAHSHAVLLLLQDAGWQRGEYNTGCACRAHASSLEQWHPVSAASQTGTACRLRTHPDGVQACPQVTVELKNDLAISGTLHSVDQYLNIKLTNTRVVNETKYPHMVRLAMPAAIASIASSYRCQIVAVALHTVAGCCVSFCALHDHRRPSIIDPT